MKYYLIKNSMTPGPDDCVARITGLETVSFEELILRATRRGLTMTDTELTGAILELMYTINEALNNGKAVETPFARYRPSIGGVFNNRDDVFESSRHTVRINCSAGKGIKVVMSDIDLEKVKHQANGPFIERIVNYSTQDENSVITPGGAAEISGDFLKIDTTDAYQGLFLIQNRTTVKVNTIIRNLPSDVIFNLPNNLAAGQYQLEIRNKTHKNDKQVKTFLFSHLLTVQ